MINIGTTDFYIDVSNLPKKKFEEYSTHLFDEWEKYVEETLGLPDYALALDVEEGSVKAFGKISVTLYALYIGIGQYGSFISGFDIIHRQVRSASQYLGNRAAAPFFDSNKKPIVRKRGEVLTSLKSIFSKIKSGELTVEQAMELAEHIIGPDILESPDFANALHTAFEETPLDPKQMPLTLEEFNNDEVEIKQEDDSSSPKPRSPRRSREVTRPQQYRVEVWRKSKKSKRNIRVTKL